MTNTPAEPCVPASPPGPSLKVSSLRGGAVRVIASVCTLAISLGSTCILARLLTPADFGLLTIVLALFGILEPLEQLGLSAATVQSTKLSHLESSSIFWANAGVGALLAAIGVGLAPVLAWYYGKPELLPVAACLALDMFLNAVALQPKAQLSRAMAFGRMTIVEVASKLAACSLGVGMAWCGAGYWSLVALSLSDSVITIILLFLVGEWQPLFQCQYAALRRFLAFGAQLTVGGFLLSLARRVDKLVLGTVCGPSEVGLYAKAEQLTRLPVSIIRGPVATIAFPALSKLQNAPAKLREYLSRSLTITAFLAMPMAAFLFAEAEILVLLFLGDKWQSAVILVQILAVNALWLPIANAGAMVLLALADGRRLLITRVISSLASLA